MYYWGYRLSTVTNKTTCHSAGTGYFDSCFFLKLTASVTIVTGYTMNIIILTYPKIHCAPDGYTH